MIHLKAAIVCLAAVLASECLADESDERGISPRFLAQRPSKTAQNQAPDKCRTNFDAAGTIQGDLLMFKGKYFWKSESSEATEIRSVWPELPASLSHIDAVYEKIDSETKSSRVWFFVGKEIYIFDGAKLEKKLTLQDIGIDPKEYSKIDAIFRWQYKNHNRTYIFSGKVYWKLDGSKVAKKYPKEIEKTWKDAFDIDTAFNFGVDQLIFLKADCYYEFDQRCMQLKLMTQYKIGVAFLGCPTAPISFNKARKISTSKDVAPITPDECQEDKDNIEKRSDSDEDANDIEDIVYPDFLAFSGNMFDSSEELM